MKLDLTHLNPEQRSAVEHAGGPLLVLAGAGSGKTRVITYRVAKLIGDGVLPEDVLGLSFTNKAAREMKERVIDLVGKRGRRVTLSTFHSLGLRILREEFESVGLSKGFTILDEGDQVAAVRNLMKQTGYDVKQADPALVLSRISQFKSKLLSPAKGAGFIDGIAGNLSGLYAQRLRAMNAVDFDDLIALPVWVLTKDENAAYKWSGTFREILVDEYQDTNWAQLQLLRLLSKRYGRVCAVGDDDQSIYAWRGAEASNILQFEKHFPGAKMIALTQNYRSTNNILKAANAVISNNKARHVKTLWSQLGDGEKVHFQSFHNGEEEGHWVAREIRTKIKSHRISPASIAILYRTNAQSRIFEETLTFHQIPFQIVGGTRFYDRREIKDLVAYMRLIANPYDEIALRRIINFPQRGIGDMTVIRISDAAKSNEISLFRMLENFHTLPFLDEKKKQSIGKFLQLIDKSRQLSRESGMLMGEVVRYLKSALSLADVWLRIEGDNKSVERRMQNIDELANAMDLMRVRQPEITLADFLSSISLDPRSDEEEEEVDQVTLMTFHGAKGLEFDHVYMVGCEEGFLPHQRHINAGTETTTISPAELDEERRLAYVGITRAKRHLNMTAANKRIHRGKMKDRRTSRFLFEIPETLLKGGHSGTDVGLEGAALERKGKAAFAEMSRLFDTD